MLTLHDIVEKKGNLPALPEVFIQITQKLNDQNSSITEIAKIIETDPVLVGKILKLSNSAFYAVGKYPVTDCKMAIVRLGLNEIKSLVFSLSVLKIFENNQLVDQSMFWQHSLSVALCSQALARITKINTNEQEQVYISGLMHDIGLLVYGYLIPQSYEQFLQRVSGDMTPRDSLQLHFQEKDAFGMDHAQLGAAYIKQWWPVDDMVVQAVKNHHSNPFQGNGYSVTDQIVVLVDKYCNGKNNTNGIKIHRKPFDENMFANFKLSDNEIVEFEDKASINFEIAKLMVAG